MSSFAGGLGCLSFLLLAGVAQTALAVDNPLTDQVRTADARFTDVKQAVAEGYAPIPCADDGAGGSMGVHFASGDRVKADDIDINKPQAILYEPEADGSLKLMAVEYFTTKGPANLGGHLFNYIPAPNRWGLPAIFELHVWAWMKNPAGDNADFNMDASCAAMTPPK
ncbi:MAG TPA: hypothetical protein VHZ56_12625 [Devosia sp.]|nr:hypothetical protein [Devosia sp.]